MSTPGVHATTGKDPARDDGVRMRMSRRPGTDHLDGGWWPRSRDLVRELADLVPALALETPLVRVQVHTAAWDPGPSTVALPTGDVAVDRSSTAEPHLVRLTTAGEVSLAVLVVPPTFTEPQGAEALLAAASRGNAVAAADLLREVLDQPDVDPRDEWSHDSRTWWEPARGASPPSP
ncbi:MAG: DUF5994 family protein [Actinomycetota bacterium]|nr:DUF5994 family protein [Actinomycetota bacterium]